MFLKLFVSSVPKFIWINQYCKFQTKCKIIFYLDAIYKVETIKSKFFLKNFVKLFDQSITKIKSK